VSEPADKGATGVSVVALILFLAALAVMTHYACGCYGPGDGPPCNASDTACGGYPGERPLRDAGP
jgi:hypothetical protein